MENKSIATPIQPSTPLEGSGGYASGTYTTTAPGTTESSANVTTRTDSIEGTNLGNDFVFKKDPFASNKGEGSLANSLTPKKYEWGSTGTINVVKDFDWTVSSLKNKKDIPWIRLIEYRCNESQIKRQINFYSKLTADTILSATGGSRGSQDVLEVYREIFPKDNPTDFSYWFPYFNKTGFELSTPDWQQLDPIGESLKQIAGGASQFASSLGLKGVSKGIDILSQTAELAAAGAQVALAAQYPSIGATDRPKVFAGHAGRQVTISFPLYNTINENAWAKNRDLIYLLMSQVNLMKV